MLKWTWIAGSLCASLLSSAPSQASTVVTSSAAPPADTFVRYDVSPVVDGAVVAVTGGFALLSEMIVRTGELRPQDPVDPANLLAIDRGIATAEEVESSGHTLSNVTLALTAAYAVFDSSRRALDTHGEWWGTYFVLYAETTFFNLALTNLAKIAFRRPRPIAYFELRQTGMVSPDTNVALSFYSGHTATTAGLAATATYLAFMRNDSAWEPWVTLAAGTLLTTYVAVQRIRARAHFPTDVIAGALVGAGVGVLVPHLHRRGTDRGAIRIGATLDASAPGLAVSGRF
jgi:undecaprenyl-diphosphatase